MRVVVAVQVGEAGEAGQVHERKRPRYTHCHSLARDDAPMGAELPPDPDGTLPEIVERPDHPWFVGVQFHPESILTVEGKKLLKNLKWGKRIILHQIGFARFCQRERLDETRALNLKITQLMALKNIGLLTPIAKL